VERPLVKVCTLRRTSDHAARRSCLAVIYFRRLASRAGNNRSEVQPVGGAPTGAVRSESARTPLNQPESTDAVAARGVRQADTKLREPLPQVPLLSRTTLPACLQDLMRSKRPARLHQLSRNLQRLHGRQGLLRHRLDTHSPVGQGPTQRIPRPSLPRATRRVTVTGHSRLLPEVLDPTLLQPIVGAEYSALHAP